LSEFIGCNSGSVLGEDVLSRFGKNDEQRQSNALFAVGTFLYLVFWLLTKYLPNSWLYYGVESFGTFLIWTGGRQLAHSAETSPQLVFLIFYQLSSAKFLFAEIVLCLAAFLLYKKNIFVLRDYGVVRLAGKRFKGANGLDLFLALYLAFLPIYFFYIQGMCSALIDKCARGQELYEVPLFFFLSFCLISCAPYFVCVALRKLKVVTVENFAHDR
jgi:hypothetical protein